MTNILANIPYQDEKMGSRKLVDEKYLLVMQAALKPGQGVPQHDANSPTFTSWSSGARWPSISPVRKFSRWKGPWSRWPTRRR